MKNLCKQTVLLLLLISGYASVKTQEPVRNKNEAEQNPKAAINLSSESKIPGVQLRIYPNPVREVGLLEITSDAAAGVKLKIYSLSGSEVGHGEVYELHEGVNRLQMNAEVLSAGTYICNIQVNNSESANVIFKKK